MTCLKNQPPVGTMKRPVVEYAMPIMQYIAIYNIYVDKSIDKRQQGEDFY